MHIAIHQARYRRLLAAFVVSLVAGTFGYATPGRAAHFEGEQARQTAALIQNGHAACFVTRTIYDQASSTNINLCSCVARIDGSATDYTGRVVSLEATLAPESACPQTAARGLSGQQLAQINAKIAEIDGWIGQYDYFMQNIWSKVDRGRYYYEPVYQQTVDAWIQQWQQYSASEKNKLEAWRAWYVSLASQRSTGSFITAPGQTYAWGQNGAPSLVPSTPPVPNAYKAPGCN